MFSLKEDRVKVVFLGEENTGKTSIISLLSDRDFSPVYAPTSCVDSSFLELKDEGVVFYFLDTPGRECNREFISNTTIYNSGALFVICVTDKNSLTRALTEFTKIRTQYKELSTEEFKKKLLLVISKVDLREVADKNSSDILSDDDISAWQETHHLLDVRITKVSVKTGEGRKNLLGNLLELTKKETRGNNPILLNKKIPPKKKKLTLREIVIKKVVAIVTIFLINYFSSSMVSLLGFPSLLPLISLFSILSIVGVIFFPKKDDSPSEKLPSSQKVNLEYSSDENNKKRNLSPSKIKKSMDESESTEEIEPLPSSSKIHF